MADQEVQGMLIQIEATTAQLRRELATADQAVVRTSRQIDRELTRVDSAFDRTAAGAQQAGSLIRGAFAAIAGAGLVGGIIKQVDAVGQMSDRMRELTGSSSEYDLVQERLLQTAKQTYRPLQEAQELYLLTADSIKSMGYDTQQTLDITDSFSYLLVTNAASADKARSALDAYSKTLMTGRVGAEEWRSILNAMPTVVKALSDATGQSVEEIKRLGIEGKLSLDDLNQGFLRTVEANRAAAERMRASVTDALVNINTALGVYLGRAEESAGAAAALADALGVVADNIDVVAAVVGGVAAGAMAAYSAKAAIATAETLRGIKVAIADRAARIAQADATLQAAIADQRKAQTATILAAREAAAARGTAVQTQMSIQLAQARQREAAATVAVATAQTGLRAASTGVLALLGGPAGIAIAAGTAAASFLLLRDNADQTGISLEDLRRPVEDLRKEFQGLARDQREAALVKWQQEQLKAAESVKDAYADLGSSLRDAMVVAGDARSPGYGQQLQQYRDLIDRLNEARSSGADLSPILREVAERLKLPSSTLDAWLSQAGAVSEADQRSAQITETLRVLTGALDDNTRATGENNAAKTGMTEAGETYLKTLNKQLAGLEDNGNAIKAAERWIREHSDATRADKDAVLAAAKAIEAQKKANQTLTKSNRDSAKSEKEKADALLAVLDRLLPMDAATRKVEEDFRLLDQALVDGTISSQKYQDATEALWRSMNSDAIRKQAEELQWLSAVEEQVATKRQSMDFSIAGIGMGDRARQELEQLNSLTREYAKRREELARLQGTSNALPGDVYAERIEALRQAEAEEIAILEEGTQRRLEAERDWTNGASRAWENYLDDARNISGQTEQLFTNAFNSMEDAIVQFAMTGKLSFADFTKSVLADMARIAARQAMTGIATSLLSSAAGAYFGGGGTGTMTGFSEGSYVENAKGGVYDGPGISAYSGSIVDSPTLFPFAKGTGLMGEAGPEAIIPLARAADGSLGVRSMGAATGTSMQINAPVAVTIEDRSNEGMELDQQALQRNMQSQMKLAAERAIADSWRAGGISFRQARGG
ncbi:phage tail tape measure protein [Stutzerimonas nitrititolerans]|uniref:phage tail tape measure protein n=1 Tax=Stutzerimonas nitrititolerans TaxID=2482751 RepID=UPI0028A59500|nr:phage tail tape measure protein [Stutzerimonas nitrititolerans]